MLTGVPLGPLVGVAACVCEAQIIAKQKIGINRIVTSLTPACRLRCTERARATCSSESRKEVASVCSHDAAIEAQQQDHHNTGRPPVGLLHRDAVQFALGPLFAKAFRASWLCLRMRRAGLMPRQV